MTFKPIVIATFDNAPKAHLARTRLEAEGIPCYLTDENIVTVNWLYAQAVGGIRLVTDERDAERARAVLAEMNMVSSEPYKRCPRCGESMQATLGSSLLNGLVLLLSLGLFMLLSGKSLVRYRCVNCGYTGA